MPKASTLYRKICATSPSTPSESHSKTMNSAGADGLLSAGTHFFFKQCIAVIGACIYAFVFTYVMLYLINKITKVKVEEADEDKGLDESLHGEKAYDEGVI